MLQEALSLNESPSEKEGKFKRTVRRRRLGTLNESPSEKEGKLNARAGGSGNPRPSMKVPPKRKGNVLEVVQRVR